MSSYDNDRIDQLFSDDWRDPGDDLERAGYLVFFGLCALMGLALTIGSVVTAVLAHDRSSLFWLTFGLGMGLVFLLTGGGLLLREARRVDWRTMTADQMVAGGVLTGLATGILGVAVLRAAPGAQRSGGAEAILLLSFFALGALILLGSLLVGLVCAFGGGRMTNRQIPVRTVLARYAVAPGGECAQEHPAPDEDGLEGWITFRGLDGRKYDFRATPQTYADAYSATGGRVKVERGVVVAIGR